MENVSEELTLIAAPSWAVKCLANLCAAVGFQEHIGLAVHTGEWPKRVGFTDNPHAFVRIPGERTQPCIIFLPPWSYDGSKWRSAICHEFVHVLMRDIDRYLYTLLTPEQIAQYYEKVEQSLKPFAILLLVADAVRAEWIEDEPKA